MAKNENFTSQRLPHLLRVSFSGSVPLFISEKDRLVFSESMRRQSERSGLTVRAYCLLIKDVYFVAVPETEASIAKTLKAAAGEYRRYYKTEHGSERAPSILKHSSCALDSAFFKTAVKFVENLPVEENLAELAEDWPWSSAPAHCGFASDHLLNPDRRLEKKFPDWTAFLREKESNKASAKLLECLSSGKPAGNSSFAVKMCNNDV